MLDRAIRTIISEIRRGKVTPKSLQAMEDIRIFLPYAPHDDDHLIGLLDRLEPLLRQAARKVPRKYSARMRDTLITIKEFRERLITSRVKYYILRKAITNLLRKQEGYEEEEETKELLEPQPSLEKMLHNFAEFTYLLRREIPGFAENFSKWIPDIHFPITLFPYFEHDIRDFCLEVLKAIGAPEKLKEIYSEIDQAVVRTYNFNLRHKGEDEMKTLLEKLYPPASTSPQPDYESQLRELLERLRSTVETEATKSTNELLTYLRKIFEPIARETETDALTILEARATEGDVIKNLFALAYGTTALLSAVGKASQYLKEHISNLATIQKDDWEALANAFRTYDDNPINTLAKRIASRVKPNLEFLFLTVSNTGKLLSELEGRLKSKFTSVQEQARDAISFLLESEMKIKSLLQKDLVEKLELSYYVGPAGMEERWAASRNMRANLALMNEAGKGIVSEIMRISKPYFVRLFGGKDSIELKVYVPEISSILERIDDVYQNKRDYEKEYNILLRAATTFVNKMHEFFNPLNPRLTTDKKYKNALQILLDTVNRCLDEIEFPKEGREEVLQQILHSVNEELTFKNVGVKPADAAIYYLIKTWKAINPAATDSRTLIDIIYRMYQGRMVERLTSISGSITAIISYEAKQRGINLSWEKEEELSRKLTRGFKEFLDAVRQVEKNKFDNILNILYNGIKEVGGTKDEVLGKNYIIRLTIDPTELVTIGTIEGLDNISCWWDSQHHSIPTVLASINVCWGFIYDEGRSEIFGRFIVYIRDYNFVVSNLRIRERGATATSRIFKDTIRDAISGYAINTIGLPGEEDETKWVYGEPASLEIR